MSDNESIGSIDAVAEDAVSDVYYPPEEEPACEDEEEIAIDDEETPVGEEDEEEEGATKEDDTDLGLSKTQARPGGGVQTVPGLAKFKAYLKSLQESTRKKPKPSSGPRLTKDLNYDPTA